MVNVVLTVVLCSPSAVTSGSAISRSSTAPTFTRSVNISLTVSVPATLNTVTIPSYMPCSTSSGICTLTTAYLPPPEGITFGSSIFTESPGILVPMSFSSPLTPPTRTNSVTRYPRLVNSTLPNGSGSTFVSSLFGLTICTNPGAVSSPIPPASSSTLPTSPPSLSAISRSYMGLTITFIPTCADGPSSPAIAVIAPTYSPACCPAAIVTVVTTLICSPLASRSICSGLNVIPVAGIT